MAQYLKSKIIKSSRKKSKGVIQYEEVSDDIQNNVYTDDTEENTQQEFDQITYTNNYNSTSNTSQIINHVGIRIDSSEDVYQDNERDDSEGEDGLNMSISKSQILINMPAEYALTQQYNNHSQDVDGNGSLFQNVDIDSNDNAFEGHNQDKKQHSRNANNFNKKLSNGKQSKGINEYDEIIVESDAWPEHQEAKAHSKIHKLLRRQMTQIDPQKIYFQQIDKDHIQELRALHEEWFPLSYPACFYNKIHKKNMLAIGCFIDLDQDNQNVILGTILVSIKTNNEDIIEMYQAKDYNQSGMFGWLRSTLTCREYQAAYIMTLGVVDECRRMGLGTLLLKEAIKALQQQHQQCEVLYLHVVDYNETAIRFYERNSFRQLKRIKDHYVIFDKNYDAYLFYKDIKHMKYELGEADVESNNENGIINIQRRQEGQDAALGYLGYLTYPISYMFSKILGKQNS